MIARLLVSLGIAVYAVAVPLLEVNASHVFNPNWPGHARLHEVWQLASNSGLGLWGLWRIWRHGDLELPSLLTGWISAGFFLAYLLQTGYGGSMRHSDGSENLLFGLNLGVVGFCLAVAMTVAGVWLQRVQQRSGSNS